MEQEKRELAEPISTAAISTPGGQTARPKPFPIPDGPLWSWLRAHLPNGVIRPTPATPHVIDTVPAPALPERFLDALEDLLGADNIRSGLEARTRPIGENDLETRLLRRQGRMTAIPDAIAFPGHGQDVTDLMRLAHDHRVALVSAATGRTEAQAQNPGAEGHESVLAVDTSRLERILAVDREARMAVLEAGTTPERLNEALDTYGLGFTPRLGPGTSFGAAVSSQRFDPFATAGSPADWLQGLALATSRGLWRTAGRTMPHGGPDASAAVIGAQDVLGLVTEVSVVLTPAERTVRGAFTFPGLDQALACARQVAQAGLSLKTLRCADGLQTALDDAFAAQADLEDERRTRSSAAPMARLRQKLAGLPETAPTILLETAGPLAKAQWAFAQRIMKRSGGLAVGAAPLAQWEAAEAAYPALEARLLDNGLASARFVTVTRWSNLSHLRNELLRALKGATHLGLLAPMAVGPAGQAHAALVLTVLYARDTAQNERSQFAALRRAIRETCLEHGGTLSPVMEGGQPAQEAPGATWLEEEKGPLGAGALAALRAYFDPAGVCNPGGLGRLPEPETEQEDRPVISENAAAADEGSEPPASLEEAPSSISPSGSSTGGAEEPAQPLRLPARRQLRRSA